MSVRVSDVRGMTSWESVRDTFSLDDTTARLVFTLCHRSDLTATEKQARLMGLRRTERDLGEVFAVRGRAYITRRGDDCARCGLKGFCAEVFDERGHCCGAERTDGRSVWFETL